MNGAPRNVLVVYKKSTYRRLVLEERSRRVSRLLAQKDASVRRLLEAHESHVATVERVRQMLDDAGVRFSVRYLGEHARVKGADLVITLGGDGTLLFASHAVGRGTAMVAINTSPRDSVGYFCAGDANDVDEVLAKALAGKLRVTRLTRMNVEVEGRVVSKRVLNDALFAHECPAATTRYIIEHGRVVEEHKSSGLWVGPPAGSTAAQRSAGGKVLPIRSRSLQFVVREHYAADGRKPALLRGLVEPGRSLVLKSKTPAGKVYLDGPNRQHDVPLGSVVRFSRSDEDLLLLGLKTR